MNRTTLLTLLAAAAVLVGVVVVASNSTRTAPTTDPLLAPTMGHRPTDSRSVVLMAIDASRSAQEFHDDWIYRMARESDRMSLDTTQELYRFDVGVHEVHVGAPLRRLEIRRLMNVLNQDRGLYGTSILELVERLDQRRAVYPHRPIDVWIFTDCGVEEMTPEDHRNLRAVVDRWADDRQIQAVHLVGVRALHREALRTGFGGLGDRLRFE